MNESIEVGLYFNDESSFRLYALHSNSIQDRTNGIRQVNGSITSGKFLFQVDNVIQERYRKLRRRTSGNFVQYSSLHFLPYLEWFGRVSGHVKLVSCCVKKAKYL